MSRHTEKPEEEQDRRNSKPSTPVKPWAGKRVPSILNRTASPENDLPDEDQQDQRPSKIIIKDLRRQLLEVRKLQSSQELLLKNLWGSARLLEEWARRCEVEMGRHPTTREVLGNWSPQPELIEMPEYIETEGFHQRGKRLRREY